MTLDRGLVNIQTSAPKMSQKPAMTKEYLHQQSNKDVKLDVVTFNILFLVTSWGHTSCVMAVIDLNMLYTFYD